MFPATFAFQFFGEFVTEGQTNGWSDKPKFVKRPSETGVQIFMCVIRFVVLLELNNFIR